MLTARSTSQDYTVNYPTVNAHFVYPGPLCEYSFKRPWETIRKFRIVPHEIHDLFDLTV